MPENNLQVYACLTRDPDLGNYLLNTTYKPYFDAKHVMDDGNSDEMYPQIEPFTTIRERLEATDHMFETTDSVFEVDTMFEAPVANIQAALTTMAKTTGIDLIFDSPEFNRLCDRSR